jgi:DNA-binding transcriptional ArsR family regulator
MEDEKITLDRESFRALASDTRISILKSLGRRRKMLAELSKELSMSPSTVKEHMESLTSAGLAVMIDDGHKWKYYELTRKGKNVLDPGQAKVWIMLSISIVGMLMASQGIILSMAPPGEMLAYGAMKAADDTALRAMVPEAAVDSGAGAPTDGVTDTPTGTEAAPPEAAPLLSSQTADSGLDSPAFELPQLPYLQIAALVAFGVLAAFCAASLAGKGKRKERF